MPLQDQLFSQIVSGAAPLNPGVGGWDIIIDQLSSDIRGRHGFGLLARLINLTPTQSGNASILISAPVGWNCMAFMISMRRAAGGSNPNSEYEFRIGGGPADTWYIRSGTQIQLDSNKDFTLIFPSSNIFATQPGAVPTVQGDDITRNTLTVQRVPAGGGTSQPIDFFIHGFAWPTDD